MVKLNKNRSENFSAFVSMRARSGSRPYSAIFIAWLTDLWTFPVNFSIIGVYLDLTYIG